MSSRVWDALIFDSRKDGNNTIVKTLTSNIREVCLRVPLGGQAEPVIRESSDVVIQTDMAQLKRHRMSGPALVN